MKALTLLLICFFSLNSFGQNVINNQDIIDMVKSGLSAEVISAKIRTSNTNFDISNEGLKTLSTEKVPDSVVVQMIEKSGKQEQTKLDESKKANSATNTIPEQGSLSDLKNKSKIYILTDDLKARDKIAEEINKHQLFTIVDKIELSDFALKFESWIETKGVVANVNGNTATATPSQVRIGVLTAIMPSETSDRLRLVYSNKKTQRFIWSEHPAESTTKEFIKDFQKLK